MIYRRISFLLMLLLLWSCSTKKNTWLSRNYHNLTAYYNVYYNGRESFRIGDNAIRESYQNDYSNILPVFESSDPDAASVASSDMDRAIEKGQKLIKKHSITAKPKKRSRNNAYAAEFYSKKEFNAWVDDAYVLIGKAHVYKHEHALAIRTLQQVVRDFPDSESMYEALIWLARAQTEKGDYVGAMAALESYDLGGNAPVEYYADYMAVYANLLLVQEKYSDAIPYLKNAYTDEKKKIKRLRYAYILGQLYLNNNQRQEAAESFGWVAKASADYEMTFNAKVNEASIVYANANIEEVKKQLHKLRKDKKNSDYLDRIYYAFGRVSLQEENEQEALYNFIKSVNFSIDNQNQKGLSYREAGEIYYSRMDFANAYFYYDSALTVIDEDFEKIDELKERHYGLSGLVEHLLTVEREDSLQHLADMSEPVLYAYLDEIIAEKEEEQKRLEKLREEESMSDAFFYQNSNVNSNMDETGKWYFYNQNSIGMGEMEFEKRWGKRKLEDNWRRKDKSKVADESNDSDDLMDLPDDPFAEPAAGNVKVLEGSASVVEEGTDDIEIPTREQLLADIPLSAEARENSDHKIELALLELGLVFMDRLENYEKSIEALEDLLQRFPNATSRDEALIALYNAYRLSNDQSGMAATQKRIEQEFPNHRFVAFLNDPDFLQKIQDRKRAEEQAYEQAYEAFLFGRFDEVIASSNVAINADEEGDELTNKYLLIRGLSYGKSGQVDAFKQDLNTIVSNDKQGEEGKLAAALLAHLGEGKEPVVGTLFASSPTTTTSSKSSAVEEEETQIEDVGFVYVENEAYELLVLDINNADMNRSVYNVADYNFSRYLLHDFEIQEKRLLDGSSVVVVSGFKNRVEVMDYFYGLRENPEFFNFTRFTDNIIALSESNSGKFYLSGLVREYKEFFDKYYLHNIDKKELDKVSLVKTPDEPKDVLAQESIESEALPKESQKEESVVVEPEVSGEGNKQEPVSNTENIEQAPPVVVQEEEAPAVTDEEELVVEQEVASIYSKSEDESHQVLVVIKKTRFDYNRLQKMMAAHTRNNFGPDHKVEILDLGASHRMLSVSGFANADDAKAFIKSLDDAPHVMRDVLRKEHYVWAITDSNLKKLIEADDMMAYDLFFKTNYK